MVKIKYILIIALYTFVACNSPKSKYCKNEYLLIHNDTLKSISVDFEQNEVDFEKQLLKELDVDSICYYSDILTLPLDMKSGDFHKSYSAINLPIIFFNDCLEDASGQLNPNLSKCTTFQLNENSIGLNGIALVPEKDSILDALEKHWLQENLTINDYDKFRSRLYLSIDFPSNNSLIKLVLDSYIQFYLSKIDNYQQKAFGESLCKTDKAAFESWIEDFIFLIHVCYTNDCVLLRQPPPPPSLE